MTNENKSEEKPTVTVHLTLESRDSQYSFGIHDGGYNITVEQGTTWGRFFQESGLSKLGVRTYNDQEREERYYQGEDREIGIHERYILQFNDDGHSGAYGRLNQVRQKLERFIERQQRKKK